MLSYVFWKGSLPISRMRGHEAHRTEGRDDNIRLVVFQTSPASVRFLFRTCIDIEYLEWSIISVEDVLIPRVKVNYCDRTLCKSKRNGIIAAKVSNGRIGFIATWNVTISRIFHEKCFPEQLSMYAIGRKKGKNMLLPRRSQSPSTLPSFELLRNRSQRPATLFPAPLLLSLPC